MYGKFIRWCEVFFGKESLARVRHRSPFYSLLEQWEEGKTSFSGDGGHVRLHMVGVSRHQDIDVNKLQVICVSSSNVREHTQFGRESVHIRQLLRMMQSKVFVREQ